MTQLLEEFRYGERGSLVPGSRFKVARGPYFEAADGERISMADKGVFQFKAYDPRGWLLAHRVENHVVGGVSVLWVGPTSKDKETGIIKRAYRIRRPKAHGVDPERLAVNDTAKKGTCSRHPTYRGLRRPRVPCPECLALYQEKNPGKSAEKPVHVPREKKVKAPKARSLVSAGDVFVAKMKAWRKAKKLTGLQVAALAGVSGAAISLLESGKAKLTQKMYDKLLPVVNT